MFRKVLLTFSASLALHAELGFDIDSLVLTEGPCQMELVSFKAESSLQFSKDLEQAIVLAHNQNKSILLLVVGGSSCPWSEKLLFDVIYKPEFYTEVQKKFIICKLEIEELASKGKELGLERPLDKIPLLVLMSKEGKVIAEKSEIPDSVKDVSYYISQVMEAHQKIELMLKASSLPESSLEDSYKLAKQLGLKSEKALFNMGMLKKKNLFFMLEKYQKMISLGTTKESKDLKLDIQRLDPRNSKGAIRSLALMEFEERSRQKKGMENPFSALKPLFEYLRDYGPYDKECRWEIEMRIARYLFSKNQVQAALQHASRSLEWAPDAKKVEVKEAVEFLKKQKDLRKIKD